MVEPPGPSGQTPKFPQWSGLADEWFTELRRVRGALAGKITATEMAEIRLSGSVEASIKCPRLVIADGAKFNGNIDTDTGSDTHPELGLQKADSAKMSH